MANFELMRKLSKMDGGKIIMLVMDGLGGLPLSVDGQTELEAATTPNTGRFAAHLASRYWGSRVVPGGHPVDRRQWKPSV